jgi:raffinose/stachyose/melibiose transport system permease protein
MILVAIVVAAPVYILVNLSFEPTSGLESPLRLATHPTFSNYISAWREGMLGTALLTSIFVTVVSVLLIVVTSAFASYPLARATARWSRLLFYSIMAGLVVPFFIALIPFYRTVDHLGLVGSPISLLVLYTGVQFPFSVFLYTAFIRQLPRDYEESAFVDGCGVARAFWSVVFPMLRPVTGTVAILNAIFIWNDFLSPLLFLGNSKYETLPVGIYGFVGQYTDQWSLIFAGVTISIIPILAVYFVMQKRMMRGFASGIKG